MDNVLQTNGVPLTVFGGAVPELAPEDLPEGASPFNQDCDYNPGSVFTRGGRTNQYTFLNQVFTANPRLGRTLPGAFAPNEVAWVTPQNIQNDNPGSYATATLNQGVNISNLVQIQQQHFNAATTNFVSSFNAPVAAGHTVVIFLFVFDSNGSVEGVNLPSITDNKLQAASRIVQSNSHTTSNFSSYIITQSSAVGGNQTYTYNLQTNAAGTLTASLYAVCMLEVMGTINAFGADPVDQTQGSDFNVGAGSQNSVNPAQNNELMLAVIQQNCNNAAAPTGAPSGTYWPWTLPGGYWHNVGAPPAFQSVSELITNPTFNTFQFQDQTLLARFLPTAGVPNAIVTIANWGPIATEQTFAQWVTLKMSNTNGVGTLGFLPVGVDSIAANNSGGTRVTTFTLPAITTTQPNDVVFWFWAELQNFGMPVPPSNWPQAIPLVEGFTTQLWAWAQVVPTPQTVTPAGPYTIGSGGSDVWCTCAFSIPILGNAPPWAMNDIFQNSPVPGGNHTYTFINNITPGSTILMLIQVFASANFPNITGVTNSVNDSFFQVSTSQVTDTLTNTLVSVSVWMAQNCHGGNNDITLHNATVVAGGGQVVAYEMHGGVAAIQPTPQSQVLAGTGYGSIPLTDSVMGVEVVLSGHQTSADPQSIVSVSLNIPGSKTVTTQLPIGADGTIVVGDNGSFSQWGIPGGITAAMIANQSFGVNIVASANPLIADTALIYGAQLRFFLSPNPPVNFNFIHTYEQTDGEIDTIALDAAGFLWDEDVDSNPTVLSTIPQGTPTIILPNTFAKAVTFADIEYIAFSNLQNGTDVPRQWNGQFLDRISMVGPGAACQAAVTGGAGGSNQTKIQNITQAPPVQIRRISWGASINAQSDSTPGNVLVISLPGGSTHGGNPPLNMNLGDTVVLSNITNPFPLKGGGSLPYNLNGTYTIQTTGQPIIGGGETDTAFTVQAPAVQYGYSNDFGVPPTSNWFYQDCVATVTLQAPLPNVNVNSQITITGTSTPYDNTWTVISAPNASSMNITSAILVGGVATYSFNLVPGSQPPANLQTVSVANVLNGSGSNDPQIFNFPAKQIQSVSVSGTSGTFTVQLPGPDVTPAQNQIGNVPPATANVAGTIFKFDAGQIVNSGNPVSGGAIVTAGQVATGQRKVCYCFLTRSGFVTQPSPISPFNVTSGAGSITVTGLSPGPPNVVARIVCFTGANGGNFFYIPTTQYVTVSGQTPIKNDSTIVNNNRDTTATFSFSDAVLLSATAIDIPGNNLFNCIELGSCRGLLTYASRMFAWSEQLKVTNFRNLSFDGGYNSASGTLLPLGWALDSTNGGGGSLSLGSPVFGWCYQINNATMSTQTTYGMLVQNAYQDEFGVAIIQANTTYSVRITALCQPQPQGGGNLVIDLNSPQVIGAVLGSFSIPLASMTTTPQIYTGTLLTNALTAPLPSDLQLRIYATNIAAGAQILIDRVEPFQTLVPVNTTALKGSYVGNQESFDLITGVCGPSQNNQPINGAFELFDLLYALKEKSWFSTFDNGVTEPNKWNWKEVSNKVGTVGIHSYDWGEGWAVSANRQGGYFFEGGEPIKITQEIQPVWDSINWQYGYTIWMRNDPEQRRITIGVPIATPNQWMPEFPVNANPTSPNVILMCNYRELNTGSALAQTGPIRSTYMGRLMSPEPARKWSFWNIRCPYSDFISRANNNWPQFYCTGYQDSKIFALQASNLSDDGQAINSFWISYGFVKPEAADAKGLGLFRMEFPYFTVLAIGSGQLNTYVYPESPFNPPYALDPQALPALSQGDLEIGVNIKGQRFFVRVGTNAVGAAFRCSKMVVPLIPDTWAPIRGYNVITA